MATLSRTAIKRENPTPNKKRIEIETLTACEYQDRLVRILTERVNEGWEIAAVTFSHLGEPAGANGYAVGFKWRHFFVVLKRVGE